MRHILMGDSVIGKVRWVHNADAVISVFMLVKLASKRPRLYQAVWLGNDVAKRYVLPAIHTFKRLRIDLFDLPGQRSQAVHPGLLPRFVRPAHALPPFFPLLRVALDAFGALGARFLAGLAALRRVGFDGV